MKGPETGDAVTWVLGKPQQGEHVLDMGGVEEFQPAELHERNVAAGEFDLERPAMRRGPKQHGLLFQQRTFFPARQHAIDDVARLIGLVADGDKPRFHGGGAVGPEILCEALPGQTDHAVCRRQDRLRRAVIAVERDDLGARRELIGKVQNITNGRGAERIDRLRVIADHGEPAPARFQRQQNRRLQAICVLVFVDQNMIETTADLARDILVRYHLRPAKQEIVVIEHVLLLLGLDIGGEQVFELIGPARAPWEELTKHLGEVGFRVDASGIDRKTGAFGGKAALGPRQAEVVANQIHQVRRIFAIVDRKSRIDADLIGIFPR